MNDKVTNGDQEERDLVKLYMDLTGASESGARSVFMYTCGDEERPAPAPKPPAEPAKSQPGAGPASGGASVVALMLAGASLWFSLAPAGAAPFSLLNQFVSQPLSMAETVNLALSQNPSILQAKKDIEATEGLIIQTRAIAIPKVIVSGDFKAVQPGDVDSLPEGVLGGAGKGLTFGTDKNWGTQIQLVQSLYEGGRMLSAFRTARLSREQSWLKYQTTLADVVLGVQVAYYDVLLAQQQIVVQEASVELLSRVLSDTTRRYEAGTVPRFNVLRAEVELANARPKLIRAKNSFRIAKNNLANLLGFDVPRDTPEDIPLTLSGKLDAEPYQVELPGAIRLALANRTELQALRKAQALRNEEVKVAKAGYKPSVQAFAGYDAHNSMFHSDLGYEVHGWVTGVEVSWNLFDGMATRGRVKQAVALSDRTGLELDDTGRRIELEVRTAYSNFIEAREVNESEKKVVEEAEEAVRLARSRYDAGTGTQLDVLSAQTALTDARTTAIQALHDYSVARARLERASGTILPPPAATPATSGTPGL